MALRSFEQSVRLTVLDGRGWCLTWLKCFLLDTVVWYYSLWGYTVSCIFSHPEMHILMVASPISSHFIKVSGCSYSWVTRVSHPIVINLWWACAALKTAQLADRGPLLSTFPPAVSARLLFSVPAAALSMLPQWLHKEMNTWESGWPP